MIKKEEIKVWFEKYPKAKEIWICFFEEWEYEEAFLRLIDLRPNIPENLYGFILSSMYQADSDGITFDTLKKAYSNIPREKLMCDEDLLKYNEFPESITIYRGTQDPQEKTPRLSWSLNKAVARRYGEAHMFKAVIPKSKVIAYYGEWGDEEEILAFVDSGFETVY